MAKRLKAINRRCHDEGHYWGDDGNCVRSGCEYHKDDKYKAILKASKAAAAKRRKQTHCKRNHPLSGKNLIVNIDKYGHRHRRCRECKLGRY